MIDIGPLTESLKGSWDASTSASPDAWTRTASSRGQCAVTALVLQDHLGGDLMRAEVDGESHYWLRTESGEDLDLTLDQFGFDPSIGRVESRSRTYVLSFPDTFARYERLRRRVEHRLVSTVA